MVISRLEDKFDSLLFLSDNLKQSIKTVIVANRSGNTTPMVKVKNRDLEEFLACYSIEITDTIQKLIDDTDIAWLIDTESLLTTDSFRFYFYMGNQNIMDFPERDIDNVTKTGIAVEYSPIQDAIVLYKKYYEIVEGDTVYYCHWKYDAEGNETGPFIEKGSMHGGADLFKDELDIVESVKDFTLFSTDRVDADQTYLHIITPKSR